MANFKKHTVELDVEKMEAFKEQFPGSSIKWFFDSCLGAFVKRIKEEKIKEQLDDIFGETVKEAIETLHEGGYTNEEIE